MILRKCFYFVKSSWLLRQISSNKGRLCHLHIWIRLWMVIKSGNCNMWMCWLLVHLFCWKIGQSRNLKGFIFIVAIHNLHTEMSSCLYFCHLMKGATRRISNRSQCTTDIHALSNLNTVMSPFYILLGNIKQKFLGFILQWWVVSVLLGLLFYGLQITLKIKVMLWFL